MTPLAANVDGKIEKKRPLKCSVVAIMKTQVTGDMREGRHLVSVSYFNPKFNINRFETSNQQQPWGRYVNTRGSACSIQLD